MPSKKVELDIKLIKFVSTLEMQLYFIKSTIKVKKFVGRILK